MVVSNLRNNFWFALKLSAPLFDQEIQSGQELINPRDHRIWLFLNGHIVLCHCGLSFDCCVHLTSHQRDGCRQRLLKHQGSSPLAFIIGLASLLDIDPEQ